MPTKHRITSSALIDAAFLFSRCGAEKETPPVRIVALDRSYQAPQGIAAGLRHIIFENRGSEIHEAMFVRLPPGMTAESYVAGLASGVSFQGAIDYSGQGLTSPGESVELWLKLDPGEYTLICYTYGHARTTRTHQLLVEEVGAKPNRPPKEDLVLKLIDYRFELEGTLRAGMQTVCIETPGPAMHEVDFFRLHEGRTPEDVRHWRKQKGQVRCQQSRSAARSTLMISPRQSTCGNTFRRGVTYSSVRCGSQTAISSMMT